MAYLNRYNNSIYLISCLRLYLYIREGVCFNYVWIRLLYMTDVILLPKSHYNLIRMLS